MGPILVALRKLWYDRDRIQEFSRHDQSRMQEMPCSNGEKI